MSEGMNVFQVAQADDMRYEAEAVEYDGQDWILVSVTPTNSDEPIRLAFADFLELVKFTNYMVSSMFR